MTDRCQVAVYYFPNYHVDPRNEAVHGPSWTEWDLMRQARPRFAGHEQPRVPAWGYEDESDPAVMARKIDAAADHGITQFIFDWYWYDDGPFLQRALEEGFLNAPNRDRLGFALMWANHDWTNIHPAKLRTEPPVLHHGRVSRATFDRLTDHVIGRYFSQPNYWKIRGRPYFSIYELQSFIESCGGLDEAARALEAFRAKGRAAGFADLHLNAIVWGRQILPNQREVTDLQQTLTTLGFDSITSYVWVHAIAIEQAFPSIEYRVMADEMAGKSRGIERAFAQTYYPNVTMGWDPSPRCCQSDRHVNWRYPFMTTVSGNTPDQFANALRNAREQVRAREAADRIVTINAWNEWTEGSYLEPDTTHGEGYLQAIREVFG